MLDFPSPPSIGAQYKAGNIVWQYDGKKWGPVPLSTSYLPLNGGTLTGDLQTSTIEASGLITPLAGIEAASDGSSATAGVVGEYQSQYRQGGSITSPSAWVNVTYLDLTAGDWDVNSYCFAAPTGGNSTYCYAALGTAANNANYSYSLWHNFLAGTAFYVPVPHCRINTSAPSTRVYLNMYGYWVAPCTGFGSVGGRIDARRMR